MKKILMIAGVVAAITPTAFAESQAQHVVQKENYSLQSDAVRAAKVSFSESGRVCNLAGDMMSRVNATGSMTFGRNIITAAEGETEEEETLSARYFAPPVGVFYVGMSPDFVFFPCVDQADKVSNFGYGGNAGNVPFYNMSTGATSYKWEYKIKGPNDKEFTDKVAETENMFAPILGPWTEMSAPVLSASNGPVKDVYTNPDVVNYVFAPTLESFGLYPSNLYGSAFDQTKYKYDYYGVSPCPVNAAVAESTYLMETVVDRKPEADFAKFYNENGACAIWESTLKAMFTAYNISDVKVTNYVNFLPFQTQPYLMNQMWLYLSYASTADATLTATVYPLDEEGAILLDSPIGSGDIYLPASAERTGNNFIVDLESVDEDGFPTQNPLAIYGSAAVVLSGVDNEAFQFITPFYNGGTIVPADADFENYYESHASIGVSFKAQSKTDATAETQNGMYAFPTAYIGLYDLKEDPENAYTPTDFEWFYNIAYPCYYNDMSTRHEITVPAAGGDVTYDVEGIYSLKSLIDEGLMTAETENCDWFTYSISETVVDGFEVDRLSIKAQALPEGEKGRYGVIKFRGFASDFNVYVGQGEYEISGIDSVVAAGKAGVEYFDLQGRRLSSVPSHGVYIKREGNKVSKHVAR